MKAFPSSPRQSRFTSRARRAELLHAFERTGMSAAAFARQYKINYTTFCGWRQRRDKAKGSPGFVEVELPAPAAPVELVIELGTKARVRVSAGQLALAAQLLKELNGGGPC